MKRLLPLVAGVLRTVADNLENRQEEDLEVGTEIYVMPDVDVMADVDDQRAHHFGTPKVLDEP